ncbi:uncharacterized protein BDR25DRAFT_362944 [Lindgomyces ingoldianus]|uniref:Uncharacterized protein n=1 Tax=Lindgomyces ingoldianus TaxID=673940 RepID=A0ACB6Q924_9PLEO|nr:uncharacterized protein BDR25DRAFT_362944 [Lindgomyces ingoldianus]KAF2463404.1 hypothetical protein BDR25DRAFT_362944 [Lindgomyces ingoldianus]
MVASALRLVAQNPGSRSQNPSTSEDSTAHSVASETSFPSNANVLKFKIAVPILIFLGTSPAQFELAALRPEPVGRPLCSLWRHQNSFITVILPPQYSSYSQPFSKHTAHLQPLLLCIALLINDSKSYSLSRNSFAWKAFYVTLLYTTGINRRPPSHYRELLYEYTVHIIQSTLANTSIRFSNDLWACAAAQLSDDDKRNINFSRPDKLNIITELHAETERSKQKSIESRWKYTRKSGETVIIRDVFEKIVRWIDIFKQVGDVATQYDPVHAALPWAGIRFVLQVCGKVLSKLLRRKRLKCLQIAVNDSNKLASVVEGLAWIAELICRYSVTEALYLQGVSEATKELERALVKLYAKVLSYLSKAKQYLEKGTAKRMLKNGLLAETQLDSCLKDIRAAETDVGRSVPSVDRNELKDLLARMDAPLRRVNHDLKNIDDYLQGWYSSKRTTVLQWLSPEPYMKYHNQAKQGVLPGTGQWLLSDSIFKKWKEESASSILWLHGIVGSGKNALESFKAGNNPQPVFFYCSRNAAEPTRADPKVILASLARQLSSPELGNRLLKPAVDLFNIKEADGFASGSLELEESCKLIMQLIEQYPLTTIVIDAMDECDPSKRRELLKTLEQILRDSSSLVKMFVSSRDDQDIVLRLHNYPNIEISSQRNADDIMRYVRSQTEQLIQEKELLQYSTSQAEMKELIINKVIEDANGMFRWASMQLQHLCSFDLDDDIKNSLGRLPPDLHTLYAEIYNLLSTKPGEVQAAVFKNVLRWLLCAQRTLNTSEFLAAVSMNPQTGDNRNKISKDIILKTCNNFVVFDSQQDTFRFAHISVREFLEQRQEYSNSASNALAAEICLWTILSTNPNSGTQRLLSKLGWYAKATSISFDGFREYSDFHWATHCQLAANERSSGRLKTAFQYVVSGDSGPASCIGFWNARLQDCRKPGQLRYAVVTADLVSAAGLFVSCAFDFHETIEDIVRKEILKDLWTHGLGHRLLLVAVRNGSCKALRSLLEQDRNNTTIAEEIVVAAARNWNSGKARSRHLNY